MLELDGSASDVLWSPSGQELMVVLAPTPSVDDSYMHKGVHVIDSESGRIIRSVGNSGKLGQHPIENHKVWLGFVGHDQRFFAIGRVEHAISFALKIVAQ